MKGAGLVQVRVFSDLHSALQAEPEPQSDQPPQMTQSGLLVALARSGPEQAAV